MEKIIDNFIKYGQSYSLFRITKYLWITRYSKLTFEYTKLLVLKILKKKIQSAEIICENGQYRKTTFLQKILKENEEMKKNR